MRSVVDLWSPYDNLFCVLKTMNSNGFLISREANVTNFTLTNLGPGIYDIKVRGVFVVMVTLLEHCYRSEHEMELVLERILQVK